tara:strand:+ start:631 stop:2022 length:1392 start_codon:yes stop_codon:yes gene_type:complete
MIKFEKNSTICPYIFKGALVEGQSRKVIPCCRWDANRPKNKKPSYDIVREFEKDQKVVDYENYFSKVREDMLKGKRVSECRRCYADEDIGLSSMRTRALDDFVSNKLELRKKEHIMRRGPKGLLSNLTNPQLEYLEIESGRYCNLKCRTCGPGLSTSWDEDLHKSKDAITNFYGNEQNILDQLQQMQPMNETLSLLTYKDCQHLKEIKVTGGEPFLTDTFLKFIENLVKWDLAKNIIIDTFTNCSFFPKEKYLTMLPKFKGVMINLSLDAVKERNEFLRKKSKWELTQKVAERWKKLASDNSNIAIRISHTISILNVLYFEEFFKWVHTFFINKSKKSWDGITVIDEIFSQSPISIIDSTVAYGPDYLSIRNFSNNVKEKLLQNIIKQKETLMKWIDSENKKWDDPISIKTNESIFEEIIATLEKKDNIVVNDKFFTKTEMFDNIRNENWRTVFPELAEILDE